MRKILLPEETERVYDFIVEYIRTHHGLSPTQDEIANGCFMSRSSVQRHLPFLHASGRIELTPGAKRSIWLPPEDTDGS